MRGNKNSLVKNWLIMTEKAFGNLTTELWYGLVAIHCSRSMGDESELSKKNNKTWSYLHYNQFSVGSASEEYPLTVGGFTGVGTARLVWLP